MGLIGLILLWLLLVAYRGKLTGLTKSTDHPSTLLRLEKASPQRTECSASAAATSSGPLRAPDFSKIP